MKATLKPKLTSTCGPGAIHQQLIEDIQKQTQKVTVSKPFESIWVWARGYLLNHFQGKCSLELKGLTSVTLQKPLLTLQLQG